MYGKGYVARELTDQPELISGERGRGADGMRDISRLDDGDADDDEQGRDPDAVPVLL